MAYNHWFVSRQKRQLTTILSALIAFNDICEGETWSGNQELQLQFEDELQNREITIHGDLRARRDSQGGGGVRTLFTQMKDLGLVYLEKESKKCRLTLIAESIVKNEISFVDAMRLQLQRYQYPSATRSSGSGSVSSVFQIHPFQFIFKLLLDVRLNNYITMDEMSGIVIHYAKRDSDLNHVVDFILDYRAGDSRGRYVIDTPTGKYHDIANTFFNYISLTQYVDRFEGRLTIRNGKYSAILAFVEENPQIIPFANGSDEENYQRKYGRGTKARDSRSFDQIVRSRQSIEESRIASEFVLLSLTTPVLELTSEIIENISRRTGIDERKVHDYLTRNYRTGNVDNFFASYREHAHMGRIAATEFEKQTTEIFSKIFNMKARHIGQSGGNTPDVIVESEEEDYCGIIDTKAYSNAYSITGDHQRVMEDVYIPNYRQYGRTERKLVFFSYISMGFKDTVDAKLQKMHSNTSVSGSAMPVDLFINFAQDYADKGYTHQDIKYLFSLNRVVQLSDFERIGCSFSEESIGILNAAEQTELFESES